jgi:PII-like signaling protein
VNEDCLKLTLYFGERDRAGHRFLADALLDLYGERELQISLLLRGAEGFGVKHHLHASRLLSLSEDLPLVSVAVDTRERIDALLPEVTRLQRGGLLTLERARMLTGELGSTALAEETKLTVYAGRAERSGGMPTYAAVCELLHARGLAGATVLLGVDGTAHGERERARFFGRNRDVPVMIVAVGAGPAIAGVLPELGALLRRPLATLERVRVCRRDGETLAEPDRLASTDEHGLPVWQKLMIYTSGHHVELVRRLRAAGAAGATTLRGVWGFHGDHVPHGDRLLQVRRHVPAVTIAIDRPERIAALFAVVTELTAERGLVTSELVPASSGSALPSDSTGSS